MNEHSTLKRRERKKKGRDSEESYPARQCQFEGMCDDAKRAPTKTCGQRHHTPGNRKKLRGVMYLVPGIVFPFGVLRETRGAGGLNEPLRCCAGATLWSELIASNRHRTARCVPRNTLLTPRNSKQCWSNFFCRQKGETKLVVFFRVRRYGCMREKNT